MKRFAFVLLVVSALLVLAVGSVSADTAYNASFTTSVTYQNVGDAEAAIVFEFYPENSGTPVQIDTTLAAGAGASIYVGNVNELPDGFSGSAVMSSDQPVLATLVQISSDPDVKNRPVSNGFEAGASEVLLATVLKNQFSTTSVFSVQNAHSSAVDLTINFYNADSPSDPPIVVTHEDLPAGAAQYYDMGTLGAISASSFNGSAVISAVDSSTSDPAPIVATSMELSTTGGASSAFEGVTSGAGTIYMPTALCEAFGATSAYAVQNTSQSAQANVTVNYSNGGSESATIDPGAKRSFIACDATGVSAGFSGAATVEATGADIVVIGKVFGSGNSTAFVGATGGADTLALPYVRFTVSQWESGARQRAYMAIQNIGSAALDPGDIVVEYRDKDGNLVGTHTNDSSIAVGAKFNTYATQATPEAGFTSADLEEFGYAGGQFGGGAIIIGPDGSEMVAIARIQSRFGTGVVGEDYNAMPID
ncbi:MAG: hypothetical protein R3248_13695 [Candidatus Promineifilaceae bacterium]|nr:hypothetical protein [Candidatus Promineifilaceae bacterium]